MRPHQPAFESLRGRQGNARFHFAHATAAQPGPTIVEYRHGNFEALTLPAQEILGADRDVRDASDLTRRVVAWS